MPHPRSPPTVIDSLLASSFSQSPARPLHHPSALHPLPLTPLCVTPTSVSLHPTPLCLSHSPSTSHSPSALSRSSPSAPLPTVSPSMPHSPSAMSVTFSLLPVARPLFWRSHSLHIIPFLRRTIHLPYILSSGHSRLPLIAMLPCSSYFQFVCLVLCFLMLPYPLYAKCLCSRRACTRFPASLGPRFCSHPPSRSPCCLLFCLSEVSLPSYRSSASRGCHEYASTSLLYFGGCFAP
ncbi:hypothetical protein B0H10DRAFT_503898 [Mycena sp. CBHHK59/15]|nr:hypothetical protein B0H10DRAFT_503898 [Mycena sp. CBHHK59/15]